MDFSASMNLTSNTAVVTLTRNQLPESAMFFELSKLLSFFLVPSNIMMILGLAGIALVAIGYARAGRWLLIASIALMAAVGILPIGRELARPLEERFPRWDATRGPPAGVLVLGGGVIKSEISADRGEIAVGDTADRILAAVELMRRYPSARVVFVGRSEADFVARFFGKLGLPEDRIFVERKSRNTIENARFAKELVLPKPGERWLLVTSAMHMPRAVGVFRKAGFDVDAYPVDYRTTSTRDLWPFLPSALMGGIGIMDRAAHEWSGLLVYWITGRTLVPFPGPTSAIPSRASPEAPPAEEAGLPALSR
jgi:uncharacterized SAM-binding protein YcdF (DUF218 family)